MRVTSKSSIISRHTNCLGGVEVVEGVEYFNEEGVSIGILGSSCGPYGVSTGLFNQCRTVTPLNEVGVTHVNGIQIAEYE